MGLFNFHKKCQQGRFFPMNFEEIDQSLTTEGSLIDGGFFRHLGEASGQV